MQPSTRVHSSCSTRHGTEKAWRWVHWECFCSFVVLFYAQVRYQGVDFCKCFVQIFFPFLALFLIRIHWIQIRIQTFCESGSISRFLTIKNSKKNITVVKNSVFVFVMQYLLASTKDDSSCMRSLQVKLQEKPPGHPREQPALQNMNFLHFYFASFLPSWIRIRNTV